MEHSTLNEITQKTYLKADLLYEFVIKYSDMMQQAHDYGSGEMLNMIEAHLLTYIALNPGITVTQLTRLWNRTKGAISQQVKKLEVSGYIEKVRHETNGKLLLLHVTPRGKSLSDTHMHYDTVDIMQTMQRLLHTCTMDEVDAFYKVVGEYIKILAEDRLT